MPRTPWHCPCCKRRLGSVVEPSTGGVFLHGYSESIQRVEPYLTPYWLLLCTCGSVVVFEGDGVRLMRRKQPAVASDLR